ncbi:MAG: CCA tRNA nucleotidyltransferase [Candidatus Omnitrophica bacterium]|nr:CCA tRNA nucleotidyltransferase [Candidatus Omnitrophota bacterium]
MDLVTTHKSARRELVSNLSKKMASVFPRSIMGLLRHIGRLANRYGYSAFVVGGPVRDLILGVRNLDLDIVIEGDAIAFGRRLSEELKVSLIVHRRFGTATIIAKDKLKIDLATARKEIYEAPGALPTVEFSSLKNDLIRRDFTINAMAVSLNKESFGQLVDFFGGESDLFAGRIRVMHNGSFIDDPTRIFRAIRFEQRFGFAIDRHTEKLILNAIEEDMFDHVEPQRIRDEIISILKEKEPIRALRRMAELDEFKFLHPKIRLDQKMNKFYSAIDEACLWYESLTFKKRPIEKWLMYLMANLEPLSYKETVDLCSKFVFKRGERLRILSYKKCARKAIGLLSVKKKIRPSRIYSILSPLSYEVILSLMARSNSGLAGTRIKDFLERHNRVRIGIRGWTLKRLGLKPGPDFKKILGKVLYKKIDGALKTKSDELEYVKGLIRKRCMEIA